MNHEQVFRPVRPRRPRESSTPASHIGWLTNLDMQVGFWPVEDERVLSEGSQLPYKRLVDPATGFIRGRLASEDEESESRKDGTLPSHERIIFLLDYPRAPYNRTFDPEEAGIIFRVNADDFAYLLSLKGIDHERAKRFSSRALVHRFSRRSPYALSTMHEREVFWAAISITYKAMVGDNPKRLVQFRNSEALEPLISLGAIFYTSESSVTCFLPFRQAVDINDLHELETLVEFSFGLDVALIKGIRRSYQDEDKNVGCVPGPLSGELFDPRNGERLPDDSWVTFPLIDGKLLKYLEYEGKDPVWKGPTESEIKMIIDACGLSSLDRWGKRDMFTEESGGDMRQIIPWKTYNKGSETYGGSGVTSQLYHNQLRLGRSFFANVFEQDEPQWLCVDFDVASKLNKKERVCVDKEWILQNMNWEEVQQWEDFGVYPEFRLSGRGFYIEFFFSQGIGKDLLKLLVDRSILLMDSLRHERKNNTKTVFTVTKSGYRVKRDVVNLSLLVRLPGSVHESVGFASRYIDGTFVPPSRRSSPEGLRKIIMMETPSITTMSSSISSPSTDDKGMLPDREKTPTSKICKDDEGESSVEWIPLSFEKDKHLYLNEVQRELLVEAIVDELLSKRGRGPRPDPIPYSVTVRIVIEQACWSGDPFFLGTRQIQFRISEVQGHEEKSRNRAAAARKTLENAGYIDLVEPHLLKGELVASGVPTPRSHAAKFEANIEKLVGMMKKAWRKHRDDPGQN